ncbi:lipocalin-like 1 protein [Urocitellus parryii]
MLQTLLISSLLVLLRMSLGWAQVPIQDNFDAVKFQGIWYIVGAVSDDQSFQDSKDDMKMPMVLVTLLANGDLDVKFGYPTGDLKALSPTLLPPPQRTVLPSMAQIDIRVPFTDYKNFAVVYFETQKGDMRNVWLQLYVRVPELFPEGAQKMQLLAPRVGLNPSQGAMLPKSDQCAAVLSQPPKHNKWCVKASCDVHSL